MSNIHNRASEALIYLAETDEECARAKARMVGLEESKKIVLAEQYMLSEQSSSAAKEKEAYASDKYKDHIKQYTEAKLDYELLNAKRATQTARFEWCRSMNANRRQGGGNL